jgi:hypothetical protein
MNLPQRSVGESDDEYHERLRAFLETFQNMAGFAVFDETNRYEIDLPRWKSEPVSQKDEKSQTSTMKLDSKACAARVRTLYPHVCDDLSDNTLTKKVLAKYPYYCDSELSLPSFIPEVQGIR